VEFWRDRKMDWLQAGKETISTWDGQMLHTLALINCATNFVSSARPQTPVNSARPQTPVNKELERVFLARAQIQLAGGGEQVQQPNGQAARGV
jgi:hypothetical protein